MGSSEAGSEDWWHRYTLNVDTLSKDRLMALWPTVAIPKTRWWVDENILSGNIAAIKSIIALGALPFVWVMLLLVVCLLKTLKSEFEERP